MRRPPTADRRLVASSCTTAARGARGRRGGGGGSRRRSARAWGTRRRRTRSTRMMHAAPRLASHVWIRVHSYIRSHSASLRYILMSLFCVYLGSRSHACAQFCVDDTSYRNLVCSFLYRPKVVIHSYACILVLDFRQTTHQTQ
jgi:hypothetical protein